MTTPADRNRSRMFAALAIGIAAAVADGCASGPATPGPVYPRDMRQSRTLDVQVFRQTKHMELTNTTAVSYGPSRLWLNGRYSRPIDGFAAGQSLNVPLDDFVDNLGDTFRGGGFFATETPERLVLVQLETKNPDGTPVLLGLVVVKSEDE